MGSSISGVLAEITMQKIEKDIFERCPTEIKLWRRLVDDILAIVPRDKIEETLNFINTINRSIQFEYETEENGMLPFLDLQILRTTAQDLKFKVHRKPTHKDIYLNADSNNPVAHKQAVIRSLVNRAYDLCSPEHVEEALGNIK